ncbi:amidohydrolase family protein [Falsiroseomonas sp. HW251]|uniref:amidohydrolase family protein n=1 Tax=Falsiroseomonas sp. HW251 TaxID=3390998 RepID=UPI003D311ECB
MDLPPPTTPGRIATEVIDCDVHPLVPNALETLSPYIPAAWNERLRRKGAQFQGTSGVPLRFQHPNGSVPRMDARGPTGRTAGSDPHHMIADLLDGNGVDIALLNCIQAGAVSAALSGVEESIVIARAYNDYFMQQWLPLDPRFRYAPTVPVQDPQEAAKEVARVATNPQVAAISLPLLNIQMGNRWYWPIYEAAQEAGLPIFLHVTGIESLIAGTPQITAGTFDHYIDRYLAMPQLAESSVRNLVFSGTLERFPRLNFLFAEFGFLWLLPLLWRMDRVWRGLRHDVPWVQRPPSQTVRERIFLTTQPVDEPDDPRDLERMMTLIGDDVLCFSSDYPHWDNDMPGSTLRFLPPETRRKLFSSNPRRALRL